MIGILSETTPLEMAGISTSQKTLETAFPGRAYPTIFYFDLAPGVDPGDRPPGSSRPSSATGWRRSRSAR